MIIYVGNLSTDFAEEELQHAFEAFGLVRSARIIKALSTRRPRAFALVDMPDDAEGQSAISGLHDKELGGQSLIVMPDHRSGIDRRSRDRGSRDRRFTEI